MRKSKQQLIPIRFGLNKVCAWVTAFDSLHLRLVTAFTWMDFGKKILGNLAILSEINVPFRIQQALWYKSLVLLRGRKKSLDDALLSPSACSWKRCHQSSRIDGRFWRKTSDSNSLLEIDFEQFKKVRNIISSTKNHDAENAGKCIQIRFF